MIEPRKAKQPVVDTVARIAVEPLHTIAVVVPGILGQRNIFIPRLLSSRRATSEVAFACQHTFVAGSIERSPQLCPPRKETFFVAEQHDNPVEEDHAEKRECKAHQGQHRVQQDCDKEFKTFHGWYLL